MRRHHHEGMFGAPAVIFNVLHRQGHTLFKSRQDAQNQTIRYDQGTLSFSDLRRCHEDLTEGQVIFCQSLLTEERCSHVLRLIVLHSSIRFD